MAIDYHKAYTNIVKVHNNLVEAQYKFSREQQLILLQVAKTLQEQDIFDKKQDTLVTYDARELADKIGVDDLRTLRGVIRSLQRCLIDVRNLDEQWEADVNVFSKGKYYTGGTVEIKLDEDMLPFFKELHERFTKLNMKELVQFKSQYSIRIYELARQLQFIKPPHKHEKVYTLDEFQAMVGSSYKTWQHIETKVLQPACDEIINNSRVWVGYEPIKEYAPGQKRGRAGVRKIKLIMQIREAYQPSLI